MKANVLKTCVGLLFAFVLLFQSSFAQESIGSVVLEPVKPSVLPISDIKTSNLIFPYSIVAVDRGSADILAQKAKGAENILQVKADRKSFPETNITIITKDGNFFSFLVHYLENPYQLNFLVKRDSSNSKKSPVELKDLPFAQNQFDQAADKFKNNAAKFLNKHVEVQLVRLSLKSIYLHKKVLLFGIEINNKSLLDYPVDTIRFFVRDKDRVKRTAQQSIELSPVFKTMCPSVTGKQLLDVVVGFNTFSISDSQELVIEVTEKNGGRTLQLPVKSKVLLRTKVY